MNAANPDVTIDDLAPVAIADVRELLATSPAQRSRAERASRQRFAGLMRDPDAIDVTIALTDEVMRVTNPSQAAKTLQRAVRQAHRSGFGTVNYLGLRAVGQLSRIAPRFALWLVHWQIRKQSSLLILPAEVAPLRRHVEDQRSAGISMNVNVLGEAVLGEAEAQERLRRVLAMMERPEISYISVKLSAVVSQLVTWDLEDSLQRVAPVLRTIYRQAMRYQVFVNLDMEEFRDLQMTTTVFRTVLDEPEFYSYRAGIVLQAYLPDAHGAFEELRQWSLSRFQRTGTGIKIRLVKGANLAMEQAEAELHGWTAAPYASKADVDASYARLLDLALRAENQSALQVGVASHNLFHVCWARAIAKERGVTAQLDIEMLEGMANAEVRALVSSGQPVLLYAPVTERDDFAAAVAYLVRRLDENTAPENYLSATFFIDQPHVFDQQRVRFEDSVRQRHTISTASRRQNRARRSGADFENAPDADPTNTTNREALKRLFAEVASPDREIPLQINGVVRRSGDREVGRDPSANNEVWYHYDVAGRSDVDDAFAAARHASWFRATALERRAVLEQVAFELEQHRFGLIATMARDAGKTVAEADPEVSEAIDFANFYARHCVDDQSTPLGVVVVVPPWNFPLAISAGGVCAALAAGNTVIFKPAPETVATAWDLATICWKAGVPRDALQFVATRDDEVGQHLVTHQWANAVVLTGAYATAELFSSWKSDLRLLAETSGKNAMIVSAFADIDLAVKDLVQSAFGHAGQKCSAASLGIIEHSVYENPGFTRQLVDAVTSLRVGPAYELSTAVGPLIRAPEGNLLRALTTLDEGESWLVQPRQLDLAGCLWSPGVKIGVRAGSWSHQTEWFGPVLALMDAPDFETAIAWQNATPYGLTAGLQSLDTEECERWISLVEAGNLYLNRGTTGAVVNRQPFGGWKRSSVGPNAKAGGENYVAALRHWEPLRDPSLSLREVDEWWTSIGGRSLDRSGLTVERNLQRYRRPLRPTIVRIDESTPSSSLSFIAGVAKRFGLVVEFSAPTSSHDAVTKESIAELLRRLPTDTKLRWLSQETAPTSALLRNGANLDPRPLAAAGAVEAPRWLLEQSVAITSHRYGNVHAGPKPACPGAGDES